MRNVLQLKDPAFIVVDLQQNECSNVEGAAHLAMPAVCRGDTPLATGIVEAV